MIVSIVSVPRSRARADRAGMAICLGSYRILERVEISMR